MSTCKCAHGVLISALWAFDPVLRTPFSITIFGPITIFVAGLQGPRVAMSRRPASQVAARK